MFYVYGHDGHLEFRIITILAKFPSLNPWLLRIKFSSNRPSSFAEEVAECADGRRTMDDGWTTEAAYPISFHESFGSGELKTPFNDYLTCNCKLQIRTYLFQIICFFFITGTPQIRIVWLQPLLLIRRFLTTLQTLLEIIEILSI